MRIAHKLDLEGKTFLKRAPYYSKRRYTEVATWQGSKMSAVKALNPKAEVTRAAQALQLNITAARGLQEVMRTNLGPKGTMKM